MLYRPLLSLPPASPPRHRRRQRPGAGRRARAETHRPRRGRPRDRRQLQERRRQWRRRRSPSAEDSSGAGPWPRRPPKRMFVKRRDEAFRRFDTNKDGQLSAAEFNAGSPVPQARRADPAAGAAAQLDTNKDKKVSLAEFGAADAGQFRPGRRQHATAPSASRSRRRAQSRTSRDARSHAGGLAARHSAGRFALAHRAPKDISSPGSRLRLRGSSRLRPVEPDPARHRRREGRGSRHSLRIGDEHGRRTRTHRTRTRVTTGPIRGSRKIHVGPLKVAMRAVDLEPSSGEPPLNLYDTSGPYTDPAVAIDIKAGLAELRRDWIRARGDVEEVAARETRPEDNGQLGPDRSGGVEPFPNVRRTRAPRQARRTTSARCTTPAAASSRPRWNMSPSAKTSAAKCSRGHIRDGEDFGAVDPRPRHPRIRPRRGRPRPRDHPQQHQPPRIRADGDRPQLPRQDQRQHRQLAPSPPTSPPKSTRWSGRSAGAPTRSWTSSPAATSTTPANGSSATRPCRSAPSPSTRRWRRSAASPRTSPGRSSATR